MEKEINNGNYIFIESWMWELFDEQNKKGKSYDYISLMIFAYIYSFSRDGVSKWYGKQQTLAKLVRCSEQTICNKLKDLVDLGIISVERVEIYGMFHHNNYMTNVFFIDGRIITVDKESSTVQRELTTVKGERTVVKGELTNNKSFNKSFNYSNEDDESSPLSVKENKIYMEKTFADSASPINVRMCINNCEEPDNIKDILTKWYDSVGIKKKVTWNIISDKLEKLKGECKTSAKVYEQINNSYLGGYIQFYPPKEENVYINNKKHTNSSESAPIDPNRSEMTF